MAHIDVAAVSATSKHRPLCSCGWEGDDTTKASAWKAADRHLFRTHQQVRPRRKDTP